MKYGKDFSGNLSVNEHSLKWAYTHTVHSSFFTMLKKEFEFLCRSLQRMEASSYTQLEELKKIMRRDQ